MKSIISKYFQLSFLFTIIFLLTDLQAQRRSTSRGSSNDTTSVRSSKSERQRTPRNSAPARTRARASERTITSFGDANQYIGSWTFESLFVPDIVDQVEDDSTGELVDIEIEEVEAGQELDGMMVDEDSDVEELNEMDFVLEIYEDGNAAFVFDTVLAVFTWTADDEAIYFEVSDTSEFTDFTYDTDDDGDPILYVSQFVEPSCDDSTFIENDEVDYEYDALTAESCADSANAVWSPGGLTVMTLVPAEPEFDSFEDAVSAYEDTEGRTITSARRKKKRGKRKRGGIGRSIRNVGRKVARKAKSAKPRKAARRVGRSARKRFKKTVKHTANFSKNFGSNAMGWAGNAANAMGSLVNDAWKDAVMRTALDANKKFNNAIKQVPNAASCFTNNQQFKNAINKALSGQSMSSAETRAIFTTILYDCNAFYALAKEVNRLGMKSIWVGGGGSVAAGFGAGRSVAFGISLTDIVNKKSVPSIAMCYVENSFIGISAGAGGEATIAWGTDEPQNSSGRSIDFSAGAAFAVGVGTSCSIQMPTWRKPGGRFLGHSISVSPGGKFEVDISVGMGCTRVVHITGGGKIYDCYIIVPEHILKQFEQEKLVPGFKILDDFKNKDNILYPNIVLKG